MWLSSDCQLNTIGHHLTICVHLQKLVWEYLSSFLFQGISSFRNKDPQGIQNWWHVGSTLAKHNFRTKKRKVFDFVSFHFCPPTEMYMLWPCVPNVLLSLFSLNPVYRKTVPFTCNCSLTQFTQDSNFFFLLEYLLA